jgi:ribosomal-protein-alanine N-acetyltransferase
VYSHIQRFFAKFPKIELGDITLRDLMLSDKGGYFDMMSHPEGVQYLSDEDIPQSVEDAESEIKYWGGLFYKRHSIFWAIADSDDKFIGTIGYNNWNFHNKRAEISYDLMHTHWRKGIMTKVLRNVIIFSFKTMDLNRIEARTMEGNIASQKLLEKVGFKYEGTQRGYRIIRGKPENIRLYSVLKQDYATFLND